MIGDLWPPEALNDPSIHSYTMSFAWKLLPTLCDPDIRERLELTAEQESRLSAKAAAVKDARATETEALREIESLGGHILEDVIAFSESGKRVHAIGYTNKPPIEAKRVENLLNTALDREERLYREMGELLTVSQERHLMLAVGSRGMTDSASGGLWVLTTSRAKTLLAISSEQDTRIQEILREAQKSWEAARGEGNEKIRAGFESYREALRKSRTMSKREATSETKALDERRKLIERNAQSEQKATHDEIMVKARADVWAALTPVQRGKAMQLVNDSLRQQPRDETFPPWEEPIATPRDSPAQRQ